jgi:hypothetical protein
MIYFWLFFFALVIALFSFGRLFWPDPDKSVTERSEKQMLQLKINLSKEGRLLSVRRLGYWIVYIFYIPYANPALGIAISVTLIALAYFM